MFEKAKTPFEQAEEFFHSAQEELYKPEEDVVHYMVCRSAYKAVQNYLVAYLTSKKIATNPTMTLENLLGMCRQADQSFNDLKLDLLYNAHEEEDVWMDMGTAQEFMDLAIRTKALVNNG